MEVFPEYFRIYSLNIFYPLTVVLCVCFVCFWFVCLSFLVLFVVFVMFICLFKMSLCFLIPARKC